MEFLRSFLRLISRRNQRGGVPKCRLFFRLYPIYLFIYCIFHLSGGQCNHQQELKLLGYHSKVEPRNKPRNWQNLFTITRFRYIDVLFHIVYYYWGKKKKKKKKVCFTEDFVMKRFFISRFHFALRIA